MGSLSIWHWLIVLVIALLLFGGRGKIPQIMGDLANGLKSFKKNMKEESETPADGHKVIQANAVHQDAVEKEKTTVKS